MKPSLSLKKAVYYESNSIEIGKKTSPKSRTKVESVYGQLGARVSLSKKTRSGYANEVEGDAERAR